VFSCFYGVYLIIRLFAKLMPKAKTIYYINIKDILKRDTYYNNIFLMIEKLKAALL